MPLLAPPAYLVPYRDRKQTAEVIYVIRDPLGSAPRMEAVAGHDWTDEEREEVGEFGAGAAGDGRRDGVGAEAKFYCICDIMLDSRVRDVAASDGDSSAWI